MKNHVSDGAKNERDKLTKFAAYRAISLPISKLNQAQYDIIMQERYGVAD
jgi:hypothetical protein